MKRILITAFLLFISMKCAAKPIFFSNVEKTEKKPTIIVLHGKTGHPESDHIKNFKNQLSAAGYTVLTPEMPWAKDRLTGTMETALDEIDAIVQSETRQKNKPVLLGHSMGATISLIYAAKRGAGKLHAVIPVALAHEPHLSDWLYEVTIDDLVTANNMLRRGMGKERADFIDLKMGRAYTINATAEFYVSFYDHNEFPSLYSILPGVKVPVLWLSAKEDWLTDIYEHEILFERLPDVYNNQYKLIAGDHFDVLENAANEVFKWLQTMRLKSGYGRLHIYNTRKYTPANVVDMR